MGLFSGGARIVTAETPLAKLTPDIVDRLAVKGRGVHHVKPRALSLTNATELGTVYTTAEVAALTEAARRHGLTVHMDGARFANALAHLGCAPADLSWRAGVDVLCLGGVKNGLAVGEAVLFFDRALAARVRVAGQAGGPPQLQDAARHRAVGGAARGRPVAAQRAPRQRHGRAAVASASRAARACARWRRCSRTRVFVELPAAVQASLRERGWRFYTFLGETGCRLMCAWDTTPDTVDRFAADVLAATSSPSPRLRGEASG